MTAADEYQRVTRVALTAYWKDPEGGRSERLPAEHVDRMAASVAQALAADPGVRAAVQREALREAARLPAATLDAAWDSNGFALRALTPPWSYLRRFLNALAAGSESTAHPQEPTDE